MPIYTFRDKNTNEVFDITLRMSDYDDYLKSNQDIERYIGSAPSVIGGVGGIRTDNGFKEVLSKVAEAHPNSELADKTLSRSSTQVKVDNVVNKYRQTS
jgi:hypothetical protein